jgi:hypothetical protein
VPKKGMPRASALKKRKSRRTRAESAKQKKKRQMFRFGAAAIQRLSPEYQGQYACPLCRILWFERAIDLGMLTLEHVPPASMVGKGIVLTCERCNSPAGSSIDAALRRREDLIQLGRGLHGHGGEYDGKAQVEIGGVRTNARLKMSGKDLAIEVRERFNNPARFKEQRASMPRGPVAPGGQPAQLKLLAPIQFKWRDALVGDLKSAYLAAFALLGYTFALHPRLDAIREQIQHPELDIIQGAWWIAPPELRVDPMVVVVRDPFPCVLVRMRSAVVLLPWPTSPPDFYDRLREHFAVGVVPFSGTEHAWPTRLECSVRMMAIAPSLRASSQHRSDGSNESSGSCSDYGLAE